MANYFCDDSLATGLNDGTTFDDAFQTVVAAIGYVSYSAGDILWIRRTSGFTATTADLSPAATSDGTWASPIIIQSWPRASHSISSSDWTNGSNTVTVDDADMDREKHQSRYITAPDGNIYVITRVVSTTSIMIDRKYPGSTVTNDATAVISADDDYTTAQAIVDTTWTIKKTNWNGDADDIILLDFGAVAYQYFVNGAYYHHYKNIEFKDGTDGSGTVAVQSAVLCRFTGCLFSQANNTEIFQVNYSSSVHFRRCTFEGMGGSNAANRISFSGQTSMIDCAIYNQGSDTVISGQAYLRNCNFGVEVANGSNTDLQIGGTSVEGYDVQTGRGFEYCGVNDSQESRLGMSYLKIENFDKTLNQNYYSCDHLHRALQFPVVYGSGDPYRRTGGSPYVIKMQCDYSSAYVGHPDPDSLSPWHTIVKYVDDVTTAKTYRFYVQSLLALDAEEFLLKCTYISDYSADDSYVYTIAYSDETISVRGSVSDWDDYIEVTGILPAIASNVRLEVMGLWASSSFTYLDPEPEII